MLRVTTAVLFIMLAGLQYRLWVGDGSVVELHKLQEQITEHSRENTALDRRNRTLDSEIASLKSGPEAVEGRARRDLGMVKDGESFYLVVPAQ